MPEDKKTLNFGLFQISKTKYTGKPKTSKPWYLQWWAIVVYIIIALMILNNIGNLPSTSSVPTKNNTQSQAVQISVADQPNTVLPTSQQIKEQVTQNISAFSVPMQVKKNGVTVTITDIGYELPDPTNVFLPGTPQNIQEGVRQLYTDYQYAIGTSRAPAIVTKLKQQYGQYLNRKLSITYNVESQTPFWFYEFNGFPFIAETNEFYNPSGAGSGIEDTKVTSETYFVDFGAPPGQYEQFYFVVIGSKGIWKLTSCDTKTDRGFVVSRNCNLSDMKAEDDVYVIELHHSQIQDYPDK